MTGPLGDPVEAQWRLAGRLAVIEMAQASGLLVAGGAEANDPVEASSTGTGELIAGALDGGARRILVGLGEVRHHRRRPRRAAGALPAAPRRGRRP